MLMSFLAELQSFVIGMVAMLLFIAGLGLVLATKKGGDNNYYYDPTNPSREKNIRFRRWALPVGWLLVVVFGTLIFGGALLSLWQPDWVTEQEVRSCFNRWGLHGFIKCDPKYVGSG